MLIDFHFIVDEDYLYMHVSYGVIFRKFYTQLFLGICDKSHFFVSLITVEGEKNVGGPSIGTA